MTKIDKAFFESSVFRDALKTIIRNGDPNVMTTASIRRELETKFDLESHALDEKPWKKMANSAIDYTFLNMNDDTAEGEQQSTQEQEKNEASPESSREVSPANTEQQTAESGGEDASDDMDVKHEPARKKNQTRQSKPKKARKIKVKEEPETEEEEERDDKHTNTDHTDEDDNSDDDENEKASLPKSSTSRKRKSSPKQNGTASKKAKSSGSEETIKRLKMYINKCGVRKVWQKELADCRTFKDQVDKLKSILESLGVTGRPTLEKCQKIKAERELKAEVESLDTDNIITDGGGRGRRSLGITRKKRVIMSDSEDDEDGGRTPDESATLDVSFLGDQSSDSD